MSELDQVCPCSAACDPKNYEGRPMLWPDEAWHNWYFNKKAHPNTGGHRKQCDKYKCRYNIKPHIHRQEVIDFVTANPRKTQDYIADKMKSTKQRIKKHLLDSRIERKRVFNGTGQISVYSIIDEVE